MHPDYQTDTSPTLPKRRPIATCTNESVKDRDVRYKGKGAKPTIDHQPTPSPNCYNTHHRRGAAQEMSLYTRRGVQKGDRSVSVLHLHCAETVVIASLGVAFTPARQNDDIFSTRRPRALARWVVYDDLPTTTNGPSVHEPFFAQCPGQSGSRPCLGGLTQASSCGLRGPSRRVEWPP